QQRGGDDTRQTIRTSGIASIRTKAQQDSEVRMIQRTDATRVNLRARLPPQPRMPRAYFSRRQLILQEAIRSTWATPHAPKKPSSPGSTPTTKQRSQNRTTATPPLLCELGYKTPCRSSSPEST